MATISRRQQQIHNRHIIQNAAMEAPVFTYEDLFESFRLLCNFLSVPEIQKLNRVMTGTLKHKRRVLLHWYDMVEARQKLLDLDARVREVRRRQCGAMPLYGRVQAVKACKALGMTVEQESWTMDVINVRIV